MKIDTAPVKLETSTRRDVPLTEVREFGFSEDRDGARLTVYVPAKGIGNAKDADVKLLWDATSVVMRFWHDGLKRQLDLPGRKGPFIRCRSRPDAVVKKCRVKTKPDKLVLIVDLELEPAGSSEDD